MANNTATDANLVEPYVAIESLGEGAYGEVWKSYLNPFREESFRKLMLETNSLESLKNLREKKLEEKGYGEVHEKYLNPFSEEGFRKLMLSRNSPGYLGEYKENILKISASETDKDTIENKLDTAAESYKYILESEQRQEYYTKFRDSINEYVVECKATADTALIEVGLIDGVDDFRTNEYCLPDYCEEYEEPDISEKVNAYIEALEIAKPYSPDNMWLPVEAESVLEINAKSFDTVSDDRKQEIYTEVRKGILEYVAALKTAADTALRAHNIDSIDDYLAGDRDDFIANCKELGIDEVVNPYIDALDIAKRYSLETMWRAVKIIHDNIQDLAAIDRFEIEAKTTSNLNHSNIVKVVDYDLGAEKPYVVMEYISIIELPSDVPEILNVTLQALEGIIYAHENGVIHRDIKPSNILLSEDGEVKVCDFGLAKLKAQDKDVRLTTTGQLIGTPEHMSPEQADDRIGKVSVRSDLYSLGSTLYYSISGEAPVKKSEDGYNAAVAAITSIINDDEIIPWPKEKEKAKIISDELADIIQMMICRTKPQFRLTTYEARYQLKDLVKRRVLLENDMKRYYELNPPINTTLFDQLEEHANQEILAVLKKEGGTELEIENGDAPAKNPLQNANDLQKAEAYEEYGLRMHPNSHEEAQRRIEVFENSLGYYAAWANKLDPSWSEETISLKDLSKDKEVNYGYGEEVMLENIEDRIKILIKRIKLEERRINRYEMIKKDKEKVDDDDDDGILNYFKKPRS